MAHSTTRLEDQFQGGSKFRAVNTWKPDDPPVERAHELVQKHWPETSRTLWLNPPAALATAPRQEEWRYWQPHFPQHAALRAQGWKELENESAWDRVVLYASKHKDENWSLLAAANHLLSPAGQLLFAVPNDYGSKSYQKGLESLTVDYQSARKSRLYKLRRGPIGEEPLSLEPLRLMDHGLWSCPGLFSWAEVDRGSELLAEAMRQEKLKGPVADLGAGWGYLASTLDDKLTVHLFESDRRGLACASRNLAGRKASTHWCDLSDTESWPAGAPTSFASVICNPPFHSGQRQQASLGQLFARLAHRLLPQGGALWLVGNTHLGYPRLLASLFSSVEVKQQKDGFSVVKAVK